jgi:hypothetical protein
VCIDGQCQTSNFVGPSVSVTTVCNNGACTTTYR